MTPSEQADFGLNKVALIGNHTPRRCGIATFTADLADALAEQSPQSAFWTVVMNDVAAGYRYPQQVRFELNESRLTDYRLAAEFLNMNQVDVACLQHEYGIFGGADGRYILRLIGELRMPVVTTLHTVLKDPSPGQLETLRKLAGLSDRLVVHEPHGGGISSGTSTRSPRRRSPSSTTASPTSRSWTPTTTRTSSAWKGGG